MAQSKDLRYGNNPEYEASLKAPEMGYPHPSSYSRYARPWRRINDCMVVGGRGVAILGDHLRDSLFRVHIDGLLKYLERGGRSPVLYSRYE